MGDDIKSRLKRCSPLNVALAHEALDYINKLERALDLYERERARFRHSHPELTGEYFLSGGHGTRDSNQLPEFVRIVPACGCAWEQIYERTDRTITYEGS